MCVAEIEKPPVVLLGNLTAVPNGYFCGGLARWSALSLDGRHYINTVRNGSEDDVLSVEPGTGNYAGEQRLVRQCNHGSIKEIAVPVVTKNCEPLVLGPAFAMDRSPGLVCFNLKFSSGNLLP